MGIELSAGEVYQLMVQTVDDVVSSEADIEMTKASRAAGRDSFYGWRRMPRRRSRRYGQEIPPSVSVDAPAVAIFDAAQTPEVAIEAHQRTNEPSATSSRRALVTSQ